jgi:acylphosphatase
MPLDDRREEPPPARTDGRQRVHAVVQGRVQGVGFRHFTRQTGRRLGLAGWVRNERDGSVTVVAEGPRHDLEALLADLRRGPSAASVDEVDALWREPAGDLDGFSVRH